MINYLTRLTRHALSTLAHVQQPTQLAQGGVADYQQVVRVARRLELAVFREEQLPDYLRHMLQVMPLSRELREYNPALATGGDDYMDFPLVKLLHISTKLAMEGGSRQQWVEMQKAIRMRLHRSSVEENIKLLWIMLTVFPVHRFDYGFILSICLGIKKQLHMLDDAGLKMLYALLATRQGESIRYNNNVLMEIQTLVLARMISRAEERLTAAQRTSQGLPIHHLYQWINLALGFSLRNDYYRMFVDFKAVQLMEQFNARWKHAVEHSHGARTAQPAEVALSFRMLEMYSSVLPFWPFPKEKQLNFAKEFEELKVNMLLHSRRIITKLMKESTAEGKLGLFRALLKTYELKLVDNLLEVTDQANRQDGFVRIQKEMNELMRVEDTSSSIVEHKLVILCHLLDFNVISVSATRNYYHSIPLHSIPASLQNLHCLLQLELILGGDDFQPRKQVTALLLDYLDVHSAACRSFDWLSFHYLTSQSPSSVRLSTNLPAINSSPDISPSDRCLYRLLQEVAATDTTNLIDEQRRQLQTKKEVKEMSKFFMEIRVHSMEKLQDIVMPFRRLPHFANSTEKVAVNGYSHEEINRQSVLLQKRLLNRMGWKVINIVAPDFLALPINERVARIGFAAGKDNVTAAGLIYSHSIRLLPLWIYDIRWVETPTFAVAVYNRSQQGCTMVKVYYSYAFDQPVGLAASRNCNFAIDPHRKVIVTASSQYVIIISLKTGEVERHLFREGKNVPVRCLRLSAHRVYAGFEDGEIAVWDLDSFELQSTLDLHKSSVAWIALSEDETRLISGGLDGHIFLWDLLAEEQQQIKSAHANAITQVELVSLVHRGKPTNVIISTGKDGFLKLWDADTRLCLSVISTQTTEALSFAYSPERSLIYVGTNKEDIALVSIHENAEGGQSLAEYGGNFKRKNYSKCQQLVLQYNHLYALTDKKLQIYELLSDQKLKQRKKRAVARRKGKEGEEEEEKAVEPVVNELELHIAAQEEKTLLYRVYNCQVVEGKIYLNNGNDIVELEGEKVITQACEKTQQLELAYPFLVQRGPRAMQIFGYGNFNRLFSIQVAALHCALFNNGYLMVVQAQKVGIWDLAKNEQLCALNQSWTGCWVRKNKCLLWRENELGIYEVGADKKGRVRMRQTTIRRFEDKISGAMYFHSFEKYAVSLQNSQIQIQFADSHKNCLRLYGHKLPPTCFDISTDDALLVSGSSDKDIRFWDLDFGHCIKAVFAHAEPVTALKFLPDTHYVLTGSSDGHVKFWDGDTHQLILDLEENLLGIRSLAVSTAGDYLVAGGLDGGFRVWKQSGDQTVAGDQDEKNNEKVMIEEYANDQLKDKEVKTRYEDLKHGEEIIEALERSEQPAVLLKLLKKISPANLSSTLSFLHATHVLKLEQYVQFLVAEKHQVELCWRIIEALGNGSTLGRQLRSTWQGLSRQLRVNREGLKMLLRTLKEEKEFSL